MPLREGYRQSQPSRKSYYTPVPGEVFRPNLGLLHAVKELPSAKPRSIKAALSEQSNGQIRAIVPALDENLSPAFDLQSGKQKMVDITPEQITDTQLLTAKLIDAFRENLTKIGTATGNGKQTLSIEDRPYLYNGADEPKRPDLTRDGNPFYNQAFQIVLNATKEFFDPAGNVLAERKQELANLTEIAPALVRSFMDRSETDRKSHITMLQESNAINLMGAAIHIAKNPNDRVLLLVGVGGTSDDAVTLRTPGYTIPGATIAEAIKDVYRERAKFKFIRAAARKAVDREFTGQDHQDPAVQKAKRKRTETLIKDPAFQYIAELSSEEMTGLRQQYGIRTKPVEIEILFAEYAAMHINKNGMTADAIQKRAFANKIAMQYYLADNHPEVVEMVRPRRSELTDTQHEQQQSILTEDTAAIVRYTKDKPWDTQGMYTQLQFEYLADLLKKGEKSDPMIKQTMDELRKSGAKHGNESGKDGAEYYAAAHVRFFDEALNIPKTSMIDGRRGKAAVVITWGGEPERKFNRVREYIAQRANVEGLQKFIEAKIRKTARKGNYQDLANLRRIQGKVEKWRVVRNKMRDEGRTHRNHLHMIRAISDIGDLATYYATRYDGSTEQDIRQHIDDTQNTLLELERQHIRPLATQRSELAKHRKILLRPGILTETQDLEAVQAFHDATEYVTKQFKAKGRLYNAALIQSGSPEWLVLAVQYLDRNIGDIDQQLDVATVNKHTGNTVLQDEIIIVEDMNRGFRRKNRLIAQPAA